jgi:hypothetical protein
MVREKKPPSALSPAEIVPREVLGIQTDVIRAPRFRDLACENTEKFDPLVGGCLISNLKVFLATNSLDGQGVGTLGHFATNDSSGSRDRVVLLSNKHVLTSGGATTLLDRRDRRLHRPPETSRRSAETSPVVI